MFEFYDPCERCSVSLGAPRCKDCFFYEPFVDEPEEIDPKTAHDRQLEYCKAYQRDDGYTHCDDCVFYDSCLKLIGGVFEYCEDFVADV